MVKTDNNQITVTAPEGPGRTVTSLVLTGVKSANYDFAAQTLTIVHSGPVPAVFDISESSTITITVSSDVYTLVVS